MLWDTAGQEEFDAITKAYYRGKWWGVSVCWSMFFWLNKELSFFVSHRKVSLEEKLIS